MKTSEMINMSRQTFMSFVKEKEMINMTRQTFMSFVTEKITMSRTITEIKKKDGAELQNKKITVLQDIIIKKAVCVSSPLLGDIITESPSLIKRQESSEDLILPEDLEGISLQEMSFADEEARVDHEDSINLVVEEGNTSNIDPSTGSDIFSKTLENLSQKNTRKRKVTQTREVKTFTKENIKYFDFISDEEIQDFQWDSSSWDGTHDEETDIEELNESKKKRKKNKKTADSADEVVGERGYKKNTTNKKKERSQKRQRGQKYTTEKGKVFPEKQIKPNPCVLAKRCAHKCHEIEEEKRESLFQYYNGLQNQRKKDWLVAMTKSKLVEENKKNKSDKPRKEKTYEYYINEGEGRRQVCLRFLLDTLSVSQKFVHYTLTNASSGLAKEDQRGKLIPQNKTKEEDLEHLRCFIKKLPAVPSHYCRKDSTRLYLPAEMKSVANLHEIYKKENDEQGRDSVGIHTFRKVFTTEYNITFHVPNKDKCRLCVAFKNKAGSSTEDENSVKKQHDEEVQISCARYKIHKQIRKSDESVLCVSFDLQKVLNTPMGNSMLLFYSRKYGVLNETFYESVTQVGYCYTWGESEGKRGANETATIIAKYILEVDQRQVARKLLMYCDSCSGQNKNKVVLAMVHSTLMKCNFIDTIQVNYLIPGHTKMPVDSMHAVIENSVAQTTVWAPSQWLTVFQMARKHPTPYIVNPLTHNDFLNCDILGDKYFKGNLAGKIRNLKIVTMKKEKPKIIMIKTSFQENSPIEEIEVLGNCSKSLQPVYKKPLPISQAKYTDLQNLCKTHSIPKVWHKEILDFPYISKKVDTLFDTDVEDETV